MCNVWEQPCPPVGRRRTQLRVQSQLCWCSECCFQSRVCFMGQENLNPGFLWCETLLHCSTKPQDNLVVCWSCFLSWVLLLFFFFPSLYPSQPFLLESSFSELLGYWALFGRGNVATCGCVSLFRCAEFAVICTSVSKQTCVWSQHITRIYFQFCQPLDQVILFCLPLPLLFLSWVGLYFFTSLPFLTTFWERSRKLGINILFLGGKPLLKLALDDVLAQVSRTTQLYWCCCRCPKGEEKRGGFIEEGCMIFFPSSCQASSKRAKTADMSRSLTCRQRCQVMPAMCFTQGCANLGIFPELDHSHKNNSLPSQM